MLGRSRLALAALLALGSVAVGSMAAQADPPLVCHKFDSFGNCTLWVPGGTGGGGGGAGGGAGGGGGGARGGGSVPMITIDGQECQPAGLSKPQPLPTDPVWKGHRDGAIFDCVVGPKVGRGGLFIAGWTILYWAASAPPAPPNPVDLAKHAMASMQLRTIEIGIVPDSGLGSVGLVGMPNWMWVARPTNNTWGPITRTASAGAWSVTATAQVSAVEWDMGDGQVISCGAGTAYRDEFGKQSSPTCGHTYTRQGSYTVRATSHWVVSWSGIGQAGAIPLDLTQTATVAIGEAQVLKQ